MTSSYILIAAILILGGLIAALGDRLGTKVGKARLRLFSLRPRQTAVVVTMVTGTLIAASTLGILLALSSSLRRGLFELDEIQKQRRQVETELKTVTKQKERVSQELTTAKRRQTEISKQLTNTNHYFQQAKQQLIEISKQAGELRTEVKKLLTERKNLLKQQTELRQQSQLLQATTLFLRSQLGEQKQKLIGKQQEIAQQDKILVEKETRLKQLQDEQSLLQQQIDRQARSIASLDRQIADKDREISSQDAQISIKDEQLVAKESQSKQLQQQLKYLTDQVEVLEQYYQNYQDLRARQIALLRGQVLALAAVRIVDPQATTVAIDRLLTQANRRAIEATQKNNSSSEQRIVKITKSQVEQLKNQIEDGKDYVVRIISAGNYVQGEAEIRVFADVTPNRQIFRQGQEIATVSIEPSTSSVEKNMQQRLDLLLSAAQFRARSAGILGDIQVENGTITILIEFLNTLRTSQETIEEIQAVATSTTPTLGPLKLRLYALKSGKILFSTKTESSEFN
jgi:uncharacterized protein (DUF3084 family)